MDAPDSLEGWIAVRDNPFIEHRDTKTRLSFHVAWNDTEGKIAITCLPRSRVASDDDCLGWSGAFTFSEVQAIHEQLTLVHPSLAPYIPQLPVEPRGLWAYILHNEPPDDDICVKIHDYLQKAHDVCGQTLLISTLFEEHTYEEYFENISALKRRVYDEAVAIADDQLQNVLFLREGSVNMLDMCEVYKQEDEALYKWNIAMAELYNYLIQPFLDMREMALGKVREAKNGLTDPNLGDRRKGEYAVMFSEWQENYIHALDRIQELYIEYYTSTVELLEAAKQRMLEDQTQFGRTTFQMTGMDRLYRISEDLCLDKLQRQQNKKKNCENQRDKVKQEIVSLMETPGGIVTELDSLEESVYEWQVKVHKHHLGIISEEERLLRMHIKSLKQEQLDEENEVYFYDTVEDPGEISSDAESASSSRKSPRLQCLNRKLAALFRKRAQIRNKKRALMKGRSEKTKQLTEVEQQVVTHHSIQIKREERQLELEKNHAFIDDERRKTMERLRQYKMKYPSPSTIRPQCRSAPKKLKKRRRKVSDRKSSLPKDDDITDACKLTSKLNDIKPSLLPAPPTSLDLSPSLPPPPPPHFPPPMFTPPPPPPPPSQFPPSPSLPVNVQRKDSVDSVPVENNELVTSGMLKTAKSGLKSRTKQQASLKQKQASDPVSDMMDIIRAGVKLRPMNCAANNISSSPFKQHAVATPAEQHTQQLKEAFMRISARLQLSEEDDESDYSAEFQDSDP